jgi:dTDP-4-dehydrorhamnose reductase
MKTILLIGKNGQLGLELQHALVPLGHVIALGRAQMDLTQPDTIRKVIRATSPQLIVNAAGYTTVDKAEQEPDLAMQVNAVATGVIAEETKRINALLVHYSTDYVFDGTKSAPYVEEDEPNPLNAYGKSKLAGERAIAAAGCPHLILRTSWIYGAQRPNFVLLMLKLARERKELFVVEDLIGSPTAASDLAESTAELLGKYRGAEEHSGVFHLSASGYASRFEFAEEIIETAKQRSGTQSGWATLFATTSANFPLPALRPRNAATSKNKIKQVFNIKMSRWEEQIEAYLSVLFSNPLDKFKA